MRSELDNALAEAGLLCFGGIALEADEAAPWTGARRPATLLLIGNAGSAIWQPFCADVKEWGWDAPGAGPRHVLDAWTRARVGPIARRLGATAVYSFDGPPWPPFQQWARRTGAFHTSPLGLTVHPVYGLWHAFRAALLIDPTPDLPTAAAETGESPCATCPARPCLTGCPIGAFTTDGYDAAGCRGYVALPTAPCATVGCAARLACPVGPDYRYAPDHTAFHMAAFLRAGT